MRRALAAATAFLAVAAASACAGEASVDKLPATFSVTCTDSQPCAGTLTVTELALSDSCRYGARAGGSGFDAPGAGEVYLEVLAEIDAESTEHPDGVLLDELSYVDDAGHARQARYVTNCREADDGRVFWTKNVAPGRSFEIYQSWIVPAETDVVIIEGHKVDLAAVSSR